MYEITMKLELIFPQPSFFSINMQFLEKKSPDMTSQGRLWFGSMVAIAPNNFDNFLLIFIEKKFLPVDCNSSQPILFIRLHVQFLALNINF